MSSKSRATPATLPTTPPTIFGVVESEDVVDPDAGSEVLLVGAEPLLVLATVWPVPPYHVDEVDDDVLELLKDEVEMTLEVE